MVLPQLQRGIAENQRIYHDSDERIHFERQKYKDTRCFNLEHLLGVKISVDWTALSMCATATQWRIQGHTKQQCLLIVAQSRAQWFKSGSGTRTGFGRLFLMVHNYCLIIPWELT